MSEWRKKDRFADEFKKCWRQILRREMMSSEKIDAELLKSKVSRTIMGFADHYFSSAHHRSGDCLRDGQEE